MTTPMETAILRVATEEDITVIQATVDYFEANQLDYSKINTEFKFTPGFVEKLRVEGIEAKMIEEDETNVEELDMF